MEKVDLQSNTFIRFGLILLVSSVFVFFYLPLLKTWFLSDDLHWMQSSATLQFREIFFVPERYRTMASNFTPMLGASFKTDWILFKMNPAGYSLHSMLSLVAASASLYFFLRLYVTTTSALVGILLFLLNPITLSTAHWFSTRHYIEGLSWGLLSLYFFVAAKRKGNISVAAGIFYLLSSLCKEVYVVLPAVAFLILDGTIRRRIKYTLPLWLGLVVYALWRLWIMGGMGGYPSNQPITFVTVFPLFLKLMSFFSLRWFGEYHLIFPLLLAVVCVFFLRGIRMPLILLVLALPLLSVANIATERFFFHISVFLVFGACLCIEEATSRKKSLHKGIMVFTIFLVAVLFIRLDISLLSTIKEDRMKAKAAAMTFVHSQKKYIESTQPSWFYESLRQIQREFLGKEITTRIVPPEHFLRYASPERLREIREAGIDMPYDDILKYQERLRKGPLTIRITLDDYKLSWDFGPDKHRSYTVLRGMTSGLYYNHSNLGPAGSIMLSQSNRDNTPDIVYLRIFYRSEDGEEIISPEFEIRIPGRQKIEYSKD